MKYLFLSLFLTFAFSIESQSKTLVILGDSITEGYGVSKESAYPALLETRIKEEKLDWKVVNSGVSGSTAASAPSRVKWIIKSKPDIVMVVLGANDGLRGVKVEESQKNLDEALKLLQSEKIEIIIAGIYMPANYGKNYSDQFKKMFSDLSKKYKAKLIPFILDKVGGDPKLNLADGIHPNEAGHKIISDNVFNQIRSVLK